LIENEGMQCDLVPLLSALVEEDYKTSEMSCIGNEECYSSVIQLCKLRYQTLSKESDPNYCAFLKPYIRHHLTLFTATTTCE